VVLEMGTPFRSQDSPGFADGRVKTFLGTQLAKLGF
jgi:hypothetical protein